MSDEQFDQLLSIGEKINEYFGDQENKIRRLDEKLIRTIEVTYRRMLVKEYECSAITQSMRQLSFISLNHPSQFGASAACQYERPFRKSKAPLHSG